MTTNSFLPENYEAPSSGGGYTKIEEGVTPIRILSAPKLFWVDWKEENGKKSPVRYNYDRNHKPAPLGKNQVKFAWCMVVFNHKTKAIEIYEPTQVSVLKELEQLYKNSRWGKGQNLFGFDIEIKRVGTAFDNTEYFVTPLPPEPVSEEIKKAYKETPVNLDALLTNGDPFGGKTDSAKPKETVVVPEPQASMPEKTFMDEDPNNQLPF